MAIAKESETKMSPNSDVLLPLLFLIFYNIVGSGMSSPNYSKLSIRIISGVNLPDTDWFFNLPDPYVVISPFSSTAHPNRTWTVQGNVNPTWNQWLNFSCQPWESFKIQVHDYDFYYDDEMSVTETIIVEPGFHEGLKHRTHGGGHLNYEYINENCTSDTCTLKITARYGKDLPDKDGFWSNSDPYMKVIAIDEKNNLFKWSSTYKVDEHNPQWNDMINFGARKWKEFKVQVWDKDVFFDDPLSDQQTFMVSGFINETDVTHACYTGSAVIDYQCL